MKKFILTEDDDLIDRLTSVDTSFELTEKDWTTFSTTLQALGYNKELEKQIMENARLYFLNLPKKKIYIGAWHRVFELLGGLPAELYATAFKANGLIAPSGYGTIKDYIKSESEIVNKADDIKPFSLKGHNNIPRKMLSSLNTLCTAKIYTAVEIGEYTLVNNAYQEGEEATSQLFNSIKNKIQDTWDLSENITLILNQLETICKNPDGSLLKEITNFLNKNYKDGMIARNKLFTNQQRGKNSLLIPYYTVIKKGADSKIMIAPTDDLEDIKLYLSNNITKALANHKENVVEVYKIGLAFQANVGFDPKLIFNPNNAATDNFALVDLNTSTDTSLVKLLSEQITGTQQPEWLQNTEEALKKLAEIFDGYARDHGFKFEQLLSRGVSLLKEEYVLHDRPSRNYYIQKKVPLTSTKCITTDRIVDEIPGTAEIEGITLVLSKDDEPVTYIGFDPDLPYSLDSMYTKQTEFAEEADADELNNWLRTNLAYWYKK